jgi:hypothetical protein
VCFGAATCDLLFKFLKLNKISFDLNKILWSNMQKLKDMYIFNRIKRKGKLVNIITVKEHK